MCKNLILLLLFLTLNILSSESHNNFINENVERLIDLRSQLVKITSKITIKNNGQDALGSFLIYLDSENGSLSYMSVKDSEKRELKKTHVSSDDKQVYNIKMNQPLNSMQNETFVFYSKYTKILQAYPKGIQQNDKQLILYYGNLYFFSPYQTKKQTTTVILNSKNIENYTTVALHSVIDNSIKYGPFDNIEPLQYDQMMVHYESNAPFLSITYLHRWIHVSHWGKIGVQEDIYIKHTGAKLISPFSRFEYQFDTGVHHHYIKSYSTVLPSAAHDIYYHDRNGNVSTATVHDWKDYVELKLSPRYPLFGGWKSTYTLGYRVPSYMYLFRALTDQFILKVPLLDHIIDDMHVEKLQTSIILPFGACNIKVETPYEIERLADTTVYKYLDVLGHTVINIQKTNLVEDHIQNVNVLYDWQPYVLLYEPMLLVILLFVLFLIIVICVHIDFSIDTKTHVKVF